MIWKGLLIFAALLAVPQAPVTGGGQTTDHSVVSHPALPVPAASTAATPAAGSSAARSDCEGGNCDAQRPYITIATAAPAPAPWPLQNRIAWGANLVLVILGYAGILLAVSLLRKIERQTKYGEAAATAAAESAQAALLHAQAILNAERPWILVTVEPSKSVDSGFTISATNRGRSPARIIAILDETRIAEDEAHLPEIPEYKDAEPNPSAAPMILLPGESAGIKLFCRQDVSGICESTERIQRVKTWEEKIYLYGKVLYRDLAAPSNQQPHETDWCCWYIHGRQNSGMVMAGPPEYNLHT